MPDHFSMYRQMTVWEYLDFFAAHDITIDDPLGAFHPDDGVHRPSCHLLLAAQAGFTFRVFLRNYGAHRPESYPARPWT